MGFSFGNITHRMSGHVIRNLANVNLASRCFRVIHESIIPYPMPKSREYLIKSRKSQKTNVPGSAKMADPGPVKNGD